MLNPKGGDREYLALSDTNPTNSQMSHTLIVSMPITNLTFKTILKKLVSSAIINTKTLCLKPQTAVTSPSSPLCLNLLHLLQVQEVPPSQLIQVEVPLKLDIRQQCIKVPGLKLRGLSLVRQ